MMKKLLITLVLLASFSLSFAYPVYSYAQIECVEKATSYELKEIKMTFNNQVRTFKTLQEAMRFLGDNGFELVASHSNCKAKDVHHYYTFKRKEKD